MMRVCYLTGRYRKWMVWVVVASFIVTLMIFTQISKKAPGNSNANLYHAIDTAIEPKPTPKAKPLEAEAEEHVEEIEPLVQEMQPLVSNSTRYLTPRFQSHHQFNSQWQYPINCTNIHRVTLGKKLGQGVSKVTYSGEFNHRRVAVKIITPGVLDIKACIKKLPGNEQDKNYKSRDNKNKNCFVFPNMKLLKEILIVSQLNHPGIVKLLGYCVRNEDTTSYPDLNAHGVVAVYEKAEGLTMEDMRKFSHKKSFDVALRLLDLLDYLEHSPLGSLVVMDLKVGNFMIDNGQIKITDLDDISSTIPRCDKPTPERPECRFSRPCVRGLCEGENAAINLNRAVKSYFNPLLQCSDDCAWKQEVNKLLSDMHDVKINARQATEALLSIRGKYNV